ncbi:MAG: helix-turn-helix domain-containing protein [bacterium]|nr:helix-turn-helix domain-containing protein [bacterium]
MSGIDKQTLIDDLMLYGMTRQEATIYIYLCRNGQLTGYEAAKLTGISRSNVYNALASLADKGAAYVMDGASSKYISVPVAEFCSNKLRHMEEVQAELTERLSQPIESEIGYITIEGNHHILDKLRNMIDAAQKRLYLSASSELVMQMASDLQNALSRDIKVVLITDHNVDLTAATVYIAPRIHSQIRLITDSEYVLTGEVTGKNTDTCLYSGQKNFVAVLKDALRNEIKLIKLEKQSQTEGEL